MKESLIKLFTKDKVINSICIKKRPKILKLFIRLNTKKAIETARRRVQKTRI